MAEIALMVAATGCLVLAAIRMADSISLRSPLQLVTSGAEDEALYSIWCVVHHQPVYPDPAAIPYTASYYNWLFYAGYGAIAGMALHTLHLGDAWLPTLCRLITLALAALGVALMNLVLGKSALSFAARVSLSIIAFFNPLCGFWIMTARPDLAAAILQLAGVALASIYFRTLRLRWIAFSALAFFAAWACKQSSLTAFLFIGLSVALLREWRALGVYTVVSLASVLLTFQQEGPLYVRQLYLPHLLDGFNASAGLRHLGWALLKMPFIAMGALICVFHEFKLPQVREPLRLGLPLLWLAALVAETIASGKTGAGDYYLIPAGVWAVLLIGIAGPRMPLAWWNGACIAASCVMLADLVFVLSGARGLLDARDPQHRFDHLARYLAARPGPVYVEPTYGDLPWISPTSPHFVIAYRYRAHPEQGAFLDQGGWQGLLARGYFMTVVTNARGSEVNPSLLTPHYRFRREDAGLLYFERK